MNKNILLLIFLFAELLLLGCKKDELVSKKALLTFNSWKLVNYERREIINEVPGVWVSKMESLDTCEKDNITFFSSDGSFRENNGAIKCWVTSPDNYATGSWTMLSNDTQVKISERYNGNNQFTYTYIFDIGKLDRNTLQLTRRQFYFEETRWTYSH
jgi:hypothetical protein